MVKEETHSPLVMSDDGARFLEKDNRLALWLLGAALLFVVVGSWIASFLILAGVIPYCGPTVPANRINVLGDTFTAVGALFSGLAFAAVTMALLFQRADLKYQRESLALQLKEYARTAKAGEISSRALTERVLQERELETNRVFLALVDEWHSERLVRDRASLRVLISHSDQSGGFDRMTIADMESLSLRGGGTLSPIPGLTFTVTDEDARAVLRLVHFVQKFQRKMAVQMIREEWPSSGIEREVGEYFQELSKLVLVSSPDWPSLVNEGKKNG
jgi:hypothetical protein